MMDINTRLCRSMLSSLIEDLRKSHPQIRVQKHAWVYDFGDGCWEMQGEADGPIAGFYWYGQADNAYDARYKGWSKWRDSSAAQEKYRNQKKGE